MGKRRLSYDETIKLLEMNVLGVRQSFVCIDGLSKYSGDEYEVRDVTVGEKDIIIKVSRLNEERIYITSHKYIKEISRMSIEDTLKAYELLDNEIIKITDETDVENNVIGKIESSIGEFELEDGMRVMLLNDKNLKYCNKILTVKGVGENIKLIANRGRPKKNL